MKQPLIVILISRTGFTLIEFSIAVFIMMVGLLGLLQAVNMATVHNLGSTFRNEAVSIADEQMVLAKVAVINSDTYTALAPSSDYLNRVSRGGFCNYSVVRSVSQLSINTKEVTIRVSWRYKGTKLNHSMSTSITNPAL